MDTNAFFNAPEDGAQAPATVEAPKKKGSALQQTMKAEFQKALADDPSLREVLKSGSENLAVVNILGSETIDNLIQDKENPTKISEKTGKEVHNVIRVPGICGYRLKNLGSTPIVYKTAQYEKGADGIYVGTEVEKTAAPGETFDLARKYFTILTSRPEYSFNLANGKVITGSDIDKCVTLDEKLERPHFTFFASENGETTSVHDDSVKIMVEDKATGAVLPEFESTFGFLYNPSTKTKGGKRTSGAKYSAQEIAANYFQSLMASANGMN